MMADIIHGLEDKKFKLKNDISSETDAKSYDIMIKEEKRRLERMKLAYQSGADTLQEYTENKKSACKRLDSLIKAKNNHNSVNKSDSFDLRSKLLTDNPDEALYNYVLKKIISKCVYRKCDNVLEIHFNV